MSNNQNKSLNDLLNEELYGSKSKQKKVKTPKPPKAPKPPNLKWYSILIISLVSAILAIAMFFIFTNTSSDSSDKKNPKQVTQTEEAVNAKEKQESVNGFTLKDSNYQAPTKKNISTAIQKDMKLADYKEVTNKHKWVIDEQYDLNDNLVGDVLLASDSFVLVEHDEKKVHSVSSFDSITSIEKYIEEILKAHYNEAK